MPPLPVEELYDGVVVSMRATPWLVRRPFAVTLPRYGAVPVTSTGWPFGPSRAASAIALSRRDTRGEAWESSLL